MKVKSFWLKPAVFSFHCHAFKGVAINEHTGHLTNTIYPSGIEVINSYDDNGILLAVDGGGNGNPTNLFTANEINSFGQYTNYILGNGRTSEHVYDYGMPTHFYTEAVQDISFEFDMSRGNLGARIDNLKGLYETFQYDDLNRLITSSVNGNPGIDLTYDGNGSFSMGNIIAKTDAGDYVHNNNKIHAVEYITNPAGNVPPIAMSDQRQDIAYTPFLKAGNIQEKTSGGNINTLDYTYGPEYHRVKSELHLPDLGYDETKYYIGNYEIQQTNNGTREIHYVGGGDGLCAVIIKEAGGPEEFYFVYKDHLGSILTVTDINANIIAEQNFDAWGRKRNPDDWNDYANISQVPEWLYRGYTGHEHLDPFGLINMNGRLYDPIQARMLGPDNYVSTPFGTQGYNRYAYAMNNPLSFVDPDGDLPILLVGALIGGVFNLANKLSQGQVDNFWDGLAAFGTGFVAGGVAVATGGAALTATGLTGLSFIGGAFSSFVGSVFSSPILGFGNAAFFGDPYSIGQFGTDVFVGTLTGGIFGGIGAGIKGNNVWTGQPAAGRSIFSFRGSPSITPQRTGSIIVEPMINEQYIDEAGNAIENFGQNQSVSPRIRGVNVPYNRYPEYPGYYATETHTLYASHGLNMNKRDFQKLVNGIKINGIQEPIKYIESNGIKVIVDGHHRYYAARGLGIMSVPIERVSLPYGVFKTIGDIPIYHGRLPGFYHYIKW